MQQTTASADEDIIWDESMMGLDYDEVAPARVTTAPNTFSQDIQPSESGIFSQILDN